MRIPFLKLMYAANYSTKYLVYPGKTSRTEVQLSFVVSSHSFRRSRLLHMLAVLCSVLSYFLLNVVLRRFQIPLQIAGDQ
jgi:hypothetical protein